MSPDPFEQLETQLREAVARRRRRAPWLRPGGLALTAVVVAGSGVAIASGVFSADGLSPAASAVRAGEIATDARPVCTTRGDRKLAIQLVSGAVDPSVRADFAVFRRPTDPGEIAAARSASKQRLFAIGGGNVLRNGIRLTRAPSGRQFALAVSYGPAAFAQRDPVACVAEVRKAALAQPQAADPKVRARIQQILDNREQRVRDLLSGRSQFLSMFSVLDKTHRAGSGGTTLIRHGRVPAIGAVNSGGVPATVGVNGLVPDEVHDIQVIDRDGSPRARSLIIPVAGNVYDAQLPRRMGPRMTLRWRDDQGRVLRRQRIRF